MKVDKIEKTEEACRILMKRISDYVLKIETRATKHETFQKESGALRRASLELTRVLADMRKS